MQKDISNNVKDDRILTPADLQRALDKFDWEAHCRKVEEAIAPVIEAYRIARAKSYAQAKYHVFV